MNIKLKKALYESIMKNVSILVKKTLNEAAGLNGRKHLHIYGTEVTHDGSVRSVNTYFNSIRNKQLLSVEDEHKLAHIILNSDNKREVQKAKDALVEANLKFVISVANQYKGTLPLEELIQYGNMGLIDAADHFDPEKPQKHRTSEDMAKMKFFSFAVWYIRKYIMSAIEEVGYGTKLPFNTGMLYRAINRIRNRYYNQDGEYPNTEYIYNILKQEDRFAKTITMDKIDDMLGISLKYDRLDTVVGGGDGDTEMTIGDRIASNTFEKPGSELDKEDLSNQLYNALNRLFGNKPQWMEIISYAFGLNGYMLMVSRDRIAEECGCSAPNVKYVLDTAYARMKKDPEIKQLFNDYCH